MNRSIFDPYRTLGLTVRAESEEIRSAYLKLVRDFPPDQSPDKFREIHDAYEILSDPLKHAQNIFGRGTKNVDLLAVIGVLEKEIPHIPTLALLSLGNVEPSMQDSKSTV